MSMKSGTTETIAGSTAHSVWSNPLDWPHIDRMILLSGMVLLVPVFFGACLIATLFLAPEWLHRQPANWLLLLYAIHTATVLSFTVIALKRRKETDRWPLFEDFIIYSYVIIVYAQSWLSGTHFTTGMLLLMFGAYMTSALADIRKVYRAYFLVVTLLIAVCIAEIGGMAKFAPLFTRVPLNPDGSFMGGWLAVQLAPVITITLFTWMGILISRRWVERENLFREMSSVDGLTRLTNRRSFLERSETEFARASRMPVTGISCVMMDIDHFKKINDTLGHPAGDTVLVQTASLLLAQARSYDEVARYGGEEFAVLLPATTLEVAFQVAERMREMIAQQQITVDGKTIRVTASFGVASFPAAGIHSISDLLKAADQALYQAKGGGRNRVVATQAVSGFAAARKTTQKRKRRS